MLAWRTAIAGAVLAALAAFALPVAAGVAKPTPSGPTCTPTTLDGSAQLDGAVTVSPMPGANDAPPQTQISFLGVPAAALAAITVTGSRSGAHAGALRPYSQGDGASFVPQKPFVAGERVTVSGSVSLPTGVQPLRFAFTVATPDPLPPIRAHGHHVQPGAQQLFRSRPDLQPPTISVHVKSSQEAPGDLLLTPYGNRNAAGPMILDPAGALLWFDPLRSPNVATNLRVQSYDGQPVLTWWQGLVTNHGFGLGEDEIVDAKYQTVATVKAGNGLQSDLHEFQITPSGTALVSAYYPIDCNLSSLGGAAASAVTDSLLQEIDIHTGLVMYQWTSVDHVALKASYSSVTGIGIPWPYDFFHLNSINLDPDGSLLISGRNTWAAYDINAATGQINWSLGGKNSSFTQGQGTVTAFQHDARPLGSDEVTVFDNGSSPQQHLQSRGVVLELNSQTHSVSVAQQFLHPGHRLLADSQGDLQALPDGHWLVGWGQEPDISEFSASGALLFDASMPSGYESYRALRFSWTGTPETLPAIAIAATKHGGRDADVSWNGDTEVARWQLLEGPSPQSLTAIGSVGRSGFETAIPLLRSGSDRYVQIRGLDATGVVLQSSASVALR